MHKAVIFHTSIYWWTSQNGLSLKGQEEAARTTVREGIAIAGLFCDVGESAKPQTDLSSLLLFCRNFKDIDLFGLENG